MIDRFDAKILNLVQANNRLTVDQIGAEIGLSPSACQRRLKRLHEDGVIRADVAIVDPARVERNLIMIIDVRLIQEKSRMMNRFKDAMRAHPLVMQCYYVTGDKDFVLIVCVRDMAEFEVFLNDYCIDNPAIARFSTSVVVDAVKTSLAVHVDSED